MVRQVFWGRASVKNPYHRANRELWNAWTNLHIENASETYHLEQFRAGDSTQAIALAQSLADEQRIDAQFICSDAYDLTCVLELEFDIVFTSYGVLPWLPDLDRWAKVVAHFLKPGGTFYMVEVHPVKRVLMPARTDGTGKPVVHTYFSRPLPLPVAERGSYANPDADCLRTAYYWAHSLGEIGTALCAAGLRLRFLHEFPRVIKDCCTYEKTGTGECEVRLRWPNRPGSSIQTKATSTSPLILCSGARCFFSV
jgi:hypothetical protein